jgi:PEP-CTERM motif
MVETRRSAWRGVLRRAARRIAGGLAATLLIAGIAAPGARADALGGTYSTDPDSGATLYTEVDGSTYFVDPSTGYLLDAADNDYIDPNTGSVYYVDPTTGGFTTTPPGGDGEAPVTVDTGADDPPTLVVGTGAGTTCATGGTVSSSCYIYSASGGTDNALVALHPSSSIDIYQQSTNGATLVNPILLIIAVPNNPTSHGQGVAELGSANVTQAVEYNPYNTTSTNCNGYTGSGECSRTVHFGSSAYGLNGFEGLFTSGDLYTFLGLGGSHTDTTATFTKMAAAEEALNAPYDLGLSSTISNFGVYVYSISSSVFGASDMISMLTSNLPEGSIVLAYGTNNSGQPYTTSLSNGGLVDTWLPEPGSLTMLASCLAGFGFLAWRRRRDGAAFDDATLTPAALSKGDEQG